MNTKPEGVKNILAVRSDRFGEFLLNIPALRALKETFRQAKLIVVVNPHVRELADSVPFIDETVAWEGRKHSVVELWKLASLLRKRNIDIALMLNPSKEMNIITFLAGIPVRAGYRRKWGFLLTHRILDRKCLGDKHEVDYNLELVSLVGAMTKDKSLVLDLKEIRITNLLEESGIKENDTLVALHPWTSDAVKQWPVACFAELAQKLSQKYPYKFLLIGGQEEVGKSRDFCALNSGLINFTGKLNLKECAVLLKKCRLLISNDSGPVHLSTAVGTPVVAIFRNDIPGKNPRRWGPWGEGNVVIAKGNLADISVDEVLDKISIKLGQ